MPVSGDTRQALKLLERIQVHLQESEAAQLSPSVGDDLNTLISVLDSPVFNSILNIQDSLQELKRQLHKHPSILPVDFDISPTTGELLLNVPADPIPLQNSDSYEPSSDNEQNYDYDGHAAKTRGTMKSDEMEPHSTEMSSIIVAPPEYALSAITTESYAEEFQRTIDQGAQGREIHTLQLFKPEGSSLGFSVVGLRSEQKGELGIFIQEIQPNGIAGRDGRLCEGDQILAIDGQPLDSNISHQQAISILQQARGLVELVVARGGIDSQPPPPLPLQRSPSDASAASDMVLSTEWAQVECVELVNDGSGLGFGIIGGRSTGVVVKTILPGGVADRDGRLRSGDHILQIGEVNLRGMGSEQVASVLRQSGQRVRLVVARPAEPPGCPGPGAAAPLVPTRILSDPEEVERRLAAFAAGGPGEPLPPYRGSPTGGAFAYRRELTDGEAPFPPSQCRGYRGEAPDLSDELPEMEAFEVELVKDQQGLGITIAGYVCEKEEISGIFVKSIAKGSAADMCGQIRVNDQIIEVDGRPLHGYTNHDAVEVLRSTGKSVKLRLARYLRGAKYQQLQLAIATGELSYPSFPTIQAQVHEAKLLTEAANKDVDVNDINLLIDNDYATPLLSRVEAAIQSKWSKIMGSEYEIVVAQLSKFREGGGLGISLEGTVEVEDGKEVRPHHYIRSILPDGPVGVSGRLQSGDELLEVNGEKLLGMNHHGVVATLKELPMHVRMVCARRPPAHEDALLSSPTGGQSHLEYDLSSALDFGCLRGQAFGGSLTSLNPSPERLVKAKSDGSLAVGACSSPPLGGVLHPSSRLKSRSLEPLTGLAMWSSEPQIIELTKGDRGLGFSILDYQDPMNPNETVIVIRSLVPGGVAQQDGRLIPGDRLLFVNDTNLENASLDAAVQALKGAPKGVVRIGVAKPLPLPESGQQMSLDSSPLLPDLRSSFELPPRLNLNLDLEQNTLGEKYVLPSVGGQSILKLLDSPVKTIRIHKGSDIFGLSVNLKESVGVLVTSVTPGSAADKDGRICPGDVLLALNGTSVLDAEPSKVGAIFRNIDKSEDDVIVQFIPSDVSELRSSGPPISSFRFLQRAQAKSDEEEDEYFDVSDSEPPDLPPIPPPTLVSDVSKVLAPEAVSSSTTEVSSRQKLAPTRLLPFESKPLSVETKISPIAIPMRPTSMSPRSLTTPTAAAPRGLDVGSLVSKVKPTVPFKPIRTSLSPKDAFPARTKPRSAPGPVGGGDLSRQWGSERSVELFRDSAKGLGISITSGKVDHSVRAGIFVKNVLPDSPAGWNGTLRRGDRILEVSGVDLRSASHAQAVDVIKNASNPVTFVIQSLVPLPKNAEEEANPLVPSAAVSPTEQSSECGKMLDNEVTSDSKPVPLHSPDIASASSSDSSSRDTTIKRKSPSSSKDDAPAPSHDTRGAPAPSPSAPPACPPDIPPPTARGDAPVAPLAKGKALTARGFQIDSSSAGNLKLTPAEGATDAENEDDFGYTNKKIQKKYGDMKGELILVDMVKGSNKLGLSLAGNKDRTKMSVFVCGMHPSGMACRDGRIRIGDELLEVNGVVVYGRCHLNASAMIKGLSGTAYKILLLRREGAVDEMAVKPLNQFPSELDEEATEDKYCHYRGMHTVTVRKGTHGLGIMIIEGKHAEVGQGIFISDIQENSAAEQAGLSVGDMILAANDTDLVGADYDTAASILKQAEGLITLIVANPNKPSPGYIYDDAKKNSELIEKSNEKNMTIKACERKKEKSPPPLPPPKPLHLTGKTTTFNNLSFSSPSEPPPSIPSSQPIAPLPLTLPPSPEPEDVDANDALSFQEDIEPLLDPKKCEIKPGKETTIEITKERMGLGLSIVGGSDTPLGVVLIHEVYPDGAAALDGRLRPGDQILEVNGEDLRNAIHERAITALRQTPTVVQMLVYREESQHEDDAFESLEVELHKKPGRGLGLSIVGRKNGPGVFISEVVKGGIAEADGRLIQGDQILEVNGQDLKSASQEHAAAVLKTTMGRIHMKIGRLKAGSRRSTSSLSTAPKIQDNLDSPAPAELKTIVLERRGSSGLGFSIVGGRGSPHGDLPVYVKRVFERGAAASEGRLRRGDQILAVGETPLEGLTHEQAAGLLKAAAGTIVLKVLS